MRTLILGLAAVTAFTAVGVLVASTEPGPRADIAQKRQIRSAGLAAIDQGGFLGGADILAKGDMKGDGGGGMMGNMGGDMMGNMGKGKGG